MDFRDFKVFTQVRSAGIRYVSLKSADVGLNGELQKNLPCKFLNIRGLWFFSEVL